MSPITQAIFGFASGALEVRATRTGAPEPELTFDIQLLNEQKKYDQIPLTLSID
jgi:hypothetical protein